jgi:hypothetical protein
MPGPAFPPTVPTLSGDVLTINRLLQSPTLVQRRLRELADRKFIADQLLTGSVEATGGAVAYEVSESIETDRDPSAVAPGGSTSAPSPPRAPHRSRRSPSTARTSRSRTSPSAGTG